MEKIYETSSIHLASFLKMKGYRMNKLSMHEDGKRVVFHFIDDDNRKTVVQEYFGNTGGFLNFIDAFNDLKAMIHNYKENV